MAFMKPFSDYDNFYKMSQMVDHFEKNGIIKMMFDIILKTNRFT